MSPKLHRELIQQFLDRLESLEEAVLLPQPDGEAVKQQFHEIEQQFTEEILPIPLESVKELSFASIWVGLQTEMHRNLRLLKTDLAFFESSLQKSKSPKTKRIYFQINEIIAMCNFLLKEDL
jgi:hypothetical protein